MMSKRRTRQPAIVPVVEAIEERVLFATFVVNTTADSGTGSLRDAIKKANSTDPVKTAQAMSGLKFKSINGNSGLGVPAGTKWDRKPNKPSSLTPIKINAPLATSAKKDTKIMWLVVVKQKGIRPVKLAVRINKKTKK